MSTTNYPSATPQSQPPRKDSKNLIIALLAVGILGTWGYFLYDKNKSDKSLAQVQKEYITVDSAKNELDKSYSAALGRLDSLTGYNNELEGKLTERNSEIKKLRTRIDGLIKKTKPDCRRKERSRKIDR
jgi:peptidoglycan hydrolase CwlO-like protein